MQYLILSSLLYLFSSCVGGSNESLSARDLNDSAVSISNHYKDTSKFEQALSIINQGIKKDSTIFDLYKNKYFFEFTLGDYESALQTNRRLIAFKSDSAELYFQSAIFEQFLQDTSHADSSFRKAGINYSTTLDTMNRNNPYYFYNWRLWAISMIMVGHENVIHKYLRENCTNSLDTAIYNPEMLSKTKKELRDVMNIHLRNQKYRR